MKDIKFSVVRVVCALVGSFAVGRAVAADAYLKSTGNQAINTGYCAKSTTAIVFDFEVDEVVPNARFFGFRKTDDPKMYFSYGTYGLSGTLTAKDVTEFWCFSDGPAWDPVSLKTYDYLGVRRVVTLDGFNNTVKVERKSDGATLFSASITRAHTRTETIPFYIFGMSCSANVDGGFYSKFKLYGCKVYEAGELVRDFIPAKNGDQAGLYDRVTGSFHVSQNNNAFDCGGDIGQIPDDAPYVETTGNQAFDTGYLTKPETRLECDFAWSQLVQNQRAFGAVNNSGGAPYVDLSCLTNTVGQFRDAWSWGDTTGNWMQMSPIFQAGFRHTVVMDSYHSKVSILYGCATNYTTTWAASPRQVTHAATNSVSLFIGSSHEKTEDNAINFGRIRLYGFRIYEKDVLIHDYRPVLRSGRAGLKDAVTGVFLNSYRGSVPSSGGGIQEDGNYLESTGVQTLTTDWCPTPDTCFVADYTSIEHVRNSRSFTCRRLSDTGIGLFVDYCSNDGELGQEYWSCKDDGGNYTELGPRTPNYLGINRRLVFDSYNSKVKMLVGERVMAENVMTTTRTKTCAWPLSVFGRRQAATTGTADMGAKMRLYSLKIYEKGELVRDYTPYVTDEGPGLKDTLTGVFCRGLGETNLTVGASVPYSPKANDAYVESQGTVGVNTGYNLTPKTRVECDFAYDYNYANYRFFGCRGNIWFSTYVDGSSCSIGWNLGDLANWKAFHGRNLLRGARQTAVLDRKNGVARLVSGGKTISETTGFVSTRTATGKFPLWIFSICADDTGLSAWAYPKMRLYRFKIYEDDVLVHDWVPKADAGAACLYDLVAQSTFALPTDKGYSIGGLGHEAEAFIESPRDTFVPYGGEPVTLTCFAPGATSYKWYCNGEELAETGPSLSVAWRKTRTPDVFSVKAVGTVRGETVTSDPASCTVSYAQLGLAIILR